MLELLGLLDRNGFSCWIFSGGGTDFMRTWTGEVYGLPPHRVIGSVGGTGFRVGDAGPELVKSATVEVVNDGPQKPSSIHQHVGQRPIVAAGNTDGDLAMLQWTAASPCRTLELVVHHTDGEREYAYDRDPILGSGTGQILAAAAEHNWTVIDMAADWSTVYSERRVKECHSFGSCLVFMGKAPSGRKDHASFCHGSDRGAGTASGSWAGRGGSPGHRHHQDAR